MTNLTKRNKHAIPLFNNSISEQSANKQSPKTINKQRFN